MLLAIAGYVVAAIAGAVVVRPVAAKVASMTSTKKDDKVVAEIGKVLDAIPLPMIKTYLAVKGVKVPEFKF